jgi:ribosome-associated translation inhibitor RaiA
MDITKQAKEQLEKRIKKIEDFIENKGVGSAQLVKAKRMQRNINLAIAIGSFITLAGITVWVLHSLSEDED